MSVTQRLTDDLRLEGLSLVLGRRRGSRFDGGAMNVPPYLLVLTLESGEETLLVLTDEDGDQNLLNGG